ncbi:MAG: hypothetical protein AAGF10_02960 [Verrucomicrobiota bacterium]
MKGLVPSILIVLTALFLSGCESYEDNVGRDPIRSTLAGDPDEAGTYTERVRAENERRTADEGENPTFDPGHTSRSNFQREGGPFDTMRQY